MVYDMAAFPPDGGAVDDSVDCEVRLAALDPRRGVISGAERHRRHEQAMNGGFGGFALAAVQHLRNCQEAIASSQPAICHPRVPHVSLPRSDVRRPEVIRCKSCATVRALGRVSGHTQAGWRPFPTGKICELETGDWNWTDASLVVVREAQPQAGSWKLEAGSWELGAGSWKLGAGNWQLATSNWQL